MALHQPFLQWVKFKMINNLEVLENNSLNRMQHSAKAGFRCIDLIYAFLLTKTFTHQFFSPNIYNTRISISLEALRDADRGTYTTQDKNTTLDNDAYSTKYQLHCVIKQHTPLDFWGNLLSCIVQRAKKRRVLKRQNANIGSISTTHQKQPSADIRQQQIPNTTYSHIILISRNGQQWYLNFHCWPFLLWFCVD